MVYKKAHGTAPSWSVQHRSKCIIASYTQFAKWVSKHRTAKCINTRRGKFTICSKPQRTSLKCAYYLLNLIASSWHITHFDNVFELMPNCGYKYIFKMLLLDLAKWNARYLQYQYMDQVQEKCTPCHQHSWRSQCGWRRLWCNKKP